MSTKSGDFSNYKDGALAHGDQSLAVVELPLSSISPNPWQPRKLFDEETITALANSIAEIGLLQPVLVRPSRVQGLDTAPHYELVAGERRWRAHKLLGKGTIKATVKEMTDGESAVAALVENVDREDLAAYEIALSIREIEKQFQTRKNVAHALGMQRSDLYRYLAFFQLPSFILDDLEKNPRLLGRDGASQIVTTLKAHGTPAIEALLKAWASVKAGEIDQSKVSQVVEAALRRGSTVNADRDVKKLYVGREEAIRITRDKSRLTYDIKVAALSAEKETELMKFVEKLLLD
jgi:ParB family chromosome partitioning protein